MALYQKILLVIVRLLPKPFLTSKETIWEISSGFSIGGSFTQPPEDLCHCLERFLFVTVGGKVFLASSQERWGCCWTPYNAQVSPPGTKSQPAPNVNSAEKPAHSLQLVQHTSSSDLAVYYIDLCLQLLKLVLAWGMGQDVEILCLLL